MCKICVRGTSRPFSRCTATQWPAGCPSPQEGIRAHQALGLSFCMALPFSLPKSPCPRPSPQGLLRRALPHPETPVQRRPKSRRAPRTVPSIPGLDTPYLTVARPEAAIYLQCSQSSVSGILRTSVHLTPPDRACGVASRTGAARRIALCAMSSPIVSSIPSSIRCPGRGGQSHCGPRPFMCSAICSSIATTWCRRRSYARTCGPPSSSATRRSRAVSSAPARPLGTPDARNSSFRPAGAMAIALSGRLRNG